MYWCIYQPFQWPIGNGFGFGNDYAIGFGDCENFGVAIGNGIGFGIYSALVMINVLVSINDLGIGIWGLGLPHKVVHI